MLVEQMYILQQQQVVIKVYCLPPLSHDCPMSQEAQREKLLVERLTRQCQQERRIATQLMHIRREKDTIRNNRFSLSLSLQLWTTN